jgi:hypothetical protein
MRWTGHVAGVEYRKGACRVLVGRPDGLRPLGRHRRRRQDNIKMNVQEVEYVDWIAVAQDRDR